MPQKDLIDLYYYHSEGYLEKTDSRGSFYRHDLMAPGQWKPLPHAIDRLVQHIQVLTGSQVQKTMLELIGLESATLSRTRRGKMKLPLDWLVRMADYSGLTLAELYAIGDIKPSVKRYDEY